MTVRVLSNRRLRVARFSRTVWSYYRAHGRHDMPWRRDTSPYAIVVSEVMLQQTQVSRVVPKFQSWMRRFPSWKSLAAASTKDVLQEWSGLGYNRRALYLRRAAEAVVADHRGKLPRAYETLVKLPGIGPNTAGAIAAYAFDEPRAFIETNIRSAFIHSFFPRSRRKVLDAELMPLVEAALALNVRRPREWHWALMDYGAHLKETLPNPSRRSAHHVRQSRFEGSNRQLRAQLLRTIMEKPATAAELRKRSEPHAGGRIDENLDALAREGFIVCERGRYRIV